MNNNANGPQREGSASNGFGKKAGLPIRKGRIWLWAALSVLFVCAVTVTVAAALGVIGTSGGGDGKHAELKGNAGVAAAYEFFSQQRERQDDQAGGVAKEIVRRLMEEPFEIESDLKVGMDGLSMPGIPLSDVSVGVDVKYDMKDLGVKVSALGMEVAGGYLIGNNVVADVMGQAGSMALEQADAGALEGSMGLKQRLYTLLPFLPEDDGVAAGLLEAFAASVPDKYTKTEAQNVYSPKDGKEISMDAVTTTLDAAAIREVAGSLEERINGDAKLSREIKELTDGFALFTGTEAATTDDAFKLLDEALESGGLSGISWSVYRRDGGFAGIRFVCTGSDVNVDYLFMSEFSGNDNYTYTKADISGAASESNVRLGWQGNKFTMEGDVTASTGAGADSAAQHMSGAFEFVKQGDGYTITGDMTMQADAPGIIENTDTMTFDIGVEADIKIGGGLGTLKETRGWSDIYEKQWGSLEDLFKMFTPGKGIFNFGGAGNNL